jgi:long-chain acyl-CoA synthetase
MRCYWGMLEETAKITLPGGWIRTGDLGRIDPVDSFVFIIDRVKDLVIRGGENISCIEVEDCIYSFPGEVVFEAACFGLPDERLGEILCAAVVVNEGKTLSAEDIIQYCTLNLAKFKVPTKIFIRSFRSPLPRGGTAKILKRVLKAEYQNFPDQHGAVVSA